MDDTWRKDKDDSGLYYSINRYGYKNFKRIGHQKERICI